MLTKSIDQRMSGCVLFHKTGLIQTWTVEHLVSHFEYMPCDCINIRKRCDGQMGRHSDRQIPDHCFMLTAVDMGSITSSGNSIFV